MQDIPKENIPKREKDEDSNRHKNELFTPEPCSKNIEGSTLIKEKPKKSKTENLLMDMNEEEFDVFGGSDLGADFASSLSSSTSQPDFDNMAMEAWEEVDNLKEEKPLKQAKLHDYPTPGSNWADDYNKGLPSKIKTNDIDVIEEDIENEIDSDYSITLKRGEHSRVFSEIKQELDIDSEGTVNFLTKEKSQFSNTFDSDNNSILNNTLNGSQNNYKI